MLRSNDRILTTHAGSLPRPRELRELHAQRFRGDTINEELLESRREAATDAVIRRQIEAGLDIVNNGEVGRESFFTYVQHRLSGFGGASQRSLMADMTRYTGFLERLRAATGDSDSVSLMAAPKAVGPISYEGTSAIDRESAQLRRLLEGYEGRYVGAFLTAPSPGIVAAAMENAHYDSLEEYVDAVADALSGEYSAVVRAGFALQIDAPDLAMERHTLFQDKPLADFLDFVGVVVRALNRALTDVPREAVRLHVCWGNYQGPHDCDVALADIWSGLEDVHAGALLLSLANPRHAHEWTLLRDRGLAPDGVVVPGVIDTTTSYVEHPETVAQRIERVAEALGDPSRVIAGTDCGFESSSGFFSVVEEIAWAKLRALSEGARLASARLF